MGTKLPWLALRRTGSKLACPWHAQTVPPLAPDAAPSLRSLSQGGILTTIRQMLATPLNAKPKPPPRPEANILAARTSVADFFAYFFHRKKKVGPHRRGESFCPKMVFDVTVCSSETGLFLVDVLGPTISLNATTYICRKCQYKFGKGRFALLRLTDDNAPKCLHNVSTKG